MLTRLNQNTPFIPLKSGTHLLHFLLKADGAMDPVFQRGERNLGVL